jgi:hypothetical protein
MTPTRARRRRLLVAAQGNRGTVRAIEARIREVAEAKALRWETLVRWASP